MTDFSIRVVRWFLAGVATLGLRKNRRGRRSDWKPIASGVDQLEARQLLTVTFHGGALLSAVEAQPVYLGSNWHTTSSLQTQTANLDQFVSTLVQSSYMDMLTQAGYNVGRGTATAGPVDSTPLSNTISDAQIQSRLQSMINAGSLQTPDANRLYVVYVEPGVVVRNGKDASNTTFLGYHGAFAGRTATGQSADIRYAVIPYPGAPNATPDSQGYGSVFDELTSVTSHELAEAVTDPDANYNRLGWYDDRLNGEIGDLTRGNTVMNGYLVQNVVDRNDRPISPTASSTPNPTPTPNPNPTPTPNPTPNPNPTPPPTTTITAPQNVTINAVSPTSASISWTAVSGTQGYRVFEVVNGQSVLLGTVSRSTTTVAVTGLTAGSTTSFVVEAFNSTSTADSSMVSVTTPTVVSTPLAAPEVTATSLSSTTALLSWNSVAGARGYRIYMVDANGQSVLLGTVNARSTSVQIVGLTAGTTTQFIVEAFNRNSVADSTVVPVTTPASSGFASVSNPKYWWMY